MMFALGLFMEENNAFFFQIFYEGNDRTPYMVRITQEEKDLLKKKYPDLSIARTMKQDSKRKHYFCEERPGAMAYLNRIRQENVLYTRKYPRKQRTGREA